VLARTAGVTVLGTITASTGGLDDEDVAGPKFGAVGASHHMAAAVGALDLAHRGRMTLIRGGGVKKESAGTTPCTPRRPANPHCLNRPGSRATAGSAQPRFAFQLLFPLNSVRVGGRSCCRGEHRFGLRHHASGSGVCRVPLVIGKTARSGSALRNGVRGP
jgi:hypothetical protein